MKYIVAGQNVTPKNYEQIGWVVDYTGDPDLMEITADSIELVNEAKELVLNHLFSGPGAGEGIPVEIQNNIGSQTLRYFIDLTDPNFRVTDNEVICPLKKRGANQKFMDDADGSSFEWLAKNGANFPVFNVPYIIVKDNRLEVGISLSVATFTMAQALANAIRDLIDVAAEFISAIGTDPSDAVAAAIKLVALIIYTIALFVAFKKLVDQLKELVFPKIRYLKGCKLKDLIIVGCNKLGYQVDSTLLNQISNVTILPVPLIKGKENILDFIDNDLNFAFNNGYPSASDTIPTLGSAIRAVETTFNAKVFVRNNVVKIERRDFPFTNFNGNIEPALAIQGSRIDSYQLNTGEIYRRNYIHYQVDPTDWHTQNEFEKTDAEYSTEPISVTNPDLVTIKGLRDVSIPFAMGSRKNKLNFIEKRVKNFFQVIDSVTSVFGNGTSYASLVQNRVGVLQIGQQFFLITKMLYTIGGKQPAGYLNYIGANVLESNYHDIDFIGNNAHFVRELNDCEIDTAQFVSLQESNRALVNGTPCELLRVEFYDEKCIAKVTYKEPFNWAFNMKKVTINE